MRGEPSLSLAFAILATVGPMGCAPRTRGGGALVGPSSGMGIALADGFGAVAAFGLTATGFSWRTPLIGSLVCLLLYLGVKMIAKRKSPQTKKTHQPSHRLPHHWA
jgi:hypothetical protein